MLHHLLQGSGLNSVMSSRQESRATFQNPQIECFEPATPQIISSIAYTTAVGIIKLQEHVHYLMVLLEQ